MEPFEQLDIKTDVLTVGFEKGDRLDCTQERGLTKAHVTNSQGNNLQEKVNQKSVWKISQFERFAKLRQPNINDSPQ